MKAGAVGGEVEGELWADGAGSDSLLLRIFVLALHRTSNLRSTTYRDLVATGNLGLLDDLHLRDRILDVYETELVNIDAWPSTEDNAYRASVLPRVPSAWSGEVVDCARASDANRLRDDWRSCARRPDGGARAVLDRLRGVSGLREALAARTYDFCQYPAHQRTAEEALDSLQAALER